MSNKCKDGQIISHLELTYKNSQDAQKVQEYLAQFDKEDALSIPDTKEFWENFLMQEE